MKRKKDRSGKVAFTAAAIVTLLVGVCVFSLYSLAENDDDSHLSIATDEESADTASGKLLSKLDDDSAVVVIEMPTAEDETSAVDEAVYMSASADSALEESASSAPEAVLDINIAVVGEDEPVYDAYDGSYYSISYDDSYWDDTYENSGETEYEPVMEAPEFMLASIDNTAEYDFAPMYEEPEYSEPVYEESVYEEPVYEAPAYEAPEEFAVVDSEYDWNYSYMDVEPEETEADGEWIYDYDSESWVYVSYNTPAYEEVPSEESWDYGYETGDNSYEEPDDTWYGYEEPEEDDNSYNGEWVYDYTTEEWIFVESGSESDDNDWVGEDPDDYWDDDSDNDWTGDDSSDDWTDDDSDDYYSNSLGQQIVDYAMGFVGVTPYVWAGRSLYSGTDCSGFCNLIYGAFGVYVSTASLAYDGSEFGYIIDASEAQPGDIAVYGGGDHVAIYAGNGYVVHCSSPENGTVYWPMTYRSDLSWFLRVLG